MKGYSTRDIAELLELPPELIREIARAGIIEPARTPGNQYRFNFQDIIVLRTAKELLQAGVRRAQINNALFKLKMKLPSNRPLTSLRITGDGGAVVIREEDQVYNPDSGQLHFNFAIADLAGTVAPLARQAAEAASQSDQLTSDDWFDLGVDLEAVSPEDAPAAYLRALELDPYHSDAHVNIGRLLQEAGEYETAEDHYNHALTAEPDNVLAAFNLGTLFEDMGRIQDAITAYKQAANLADAHYNLSRLYELVGEHAEALKHLKTYRSLIDPN
ncbi:MAG: tetratricopeptide repeat protein [Gammaproteobacteria bacterium]|jgi:tetratricopeptide (TPR) repeat protein|nr:tetratricopeptide repeat protein [Gammaproteobacteria bacterium]MBT4491991.1 tetratricopeptide repeat protein [Gammaproteobacteria bacterium]MBT7370470.1 tetratricopeptide repeat protein [Gammaproteobacteria bacterium]